MTETRSELGPFESEVEAIMGVDPDYSASLRTGESPQNQRYAVSRIEGIEYAARHVSGDHSPENIRSLLEEGEYTEARERARSIDRGLSRVDGETAEAIFALNNFAAGLITLSGGGLEEGKSMKEHYSDVNEKTGSLVDGYDEIIAVLENIEGKIGAVGEN